MTLTARRPPAPPANRRKPAGRLRWGRVAGIVTWPARRVGRWLVLWPDRVGVIAGVAVVAARAGAGGGAFGVAAAAIVGLSVSPDRTGVRSSIAEANKFRHIRHRILWRWNDITADCGLAKPSTNGGTDKRRPRIRAIRREALGVRVLVDGSTVSAGADTFAAVADRICAALKAHHVDIKPAGRLVAIHLRYQHPTHFGARPIRYRELTQDTRPLHVTVGLDEDRRPVVRDLRLPHLLIGAPGSGKSSETWVILGALLHARIPFRLRVFDPKGGQEFIALEESAWEYERRPYAWPQFLEHAHRTLSAKQAALRERRVTELTEFTARMPLDVMLIDELLTALAMGRGAGRKTKVGGQAISTDDAFLLYLSQIRSVGATVLAGSQLAAKDDIGSVREMFANVACLRVVPTARSVVDMALGSGASKLYPAHQLSNDRRFAGIGFTTTETGEIVKYRGALLTNAERAAVVRGVAAMTKAIRAVTTEDDP